MGFECKELRDLAEGQECTFKIPDVCNHRTDTTVWCHSNEGRHGKGKGTKAHDVFGAFGCQACHHWYDVGRDPRGQKAEAFRGAMETTLLVIWAIGLVGVAVRGASPAKRVKAAPAAKFIKQSLPVRHARSIVSQE